MTGRALHELYGFLSALDCQSKSNREIEKGLPRGTKAETLSGTLVQAFYNPQNIIVSHTPEIESPGQIFANESVRILVCTPLPGTVGMGKVHRSPQGGGYLPVPGKLLAIVRRQAAALQSIEQTDQGNLNSSRSPVLYLCCQQQASLSVNHGNQAPCPRLAQNGVHLPVSDVKPLPGVPGSKLDGNAVPETPPAILPRLPPVGLAPAPQMFPCVKGQAPELHGPVDGADGYCKGFPAPDLFRRPALLKPGLEKGLQCLVLQPESRPAALAAQTIELVCLVGTAGSLGDCAEALC